jgi:U3 small nucleolar RNA-associated protein 12
MSKSYFSFVKKAGFGDVAGPAGALFLAGNKTLIVAGQASLALWDLRKNHVIVQKSFESPLTCLEERGLIAAGFRDGKVIVFMDSFEVRHSFEGHESAVSALLFAKDGLTLYSGSFDTSIIVWDLVADSAVKKLQGHRDSITGLSWSEGLLFSSSRDKTIKVWEREMSIQTLLCPSEAWGVSASEGKIIVSCEKHLKFWDFSFKELGNLERSDSKKGKKVLIQNDLVLCSSPEKLEIWRSRQSKEIEKKLKRRRKRNRDQDLELQFPDYYEKILSFKPDFKISSASLSQIPEKSKTFETRLKLSISSSKNHLQVYSLDYNSKKNQKTSPVLSLVNEISHEGHRSPARTLSISEDNSTLLSGSAESVKIWDLSRQKCLVSIESGYCLCSSWFPGDKFAVVGCRDGTLQLFDVLASELAFKLQAHEGSIWTCDLKDQVLYTGSSDCCIKFWTLDLKTKELRNFDKLVMKDEVLCVKLTPDRRLLCAALLDCTIQVLYADSHKLLFSLYAHKLPVTCFDVTYDCSLLVSGSSDKNLKVWGLDFGDCRKSVIAHSQGLTDVKCLPSTHFAFSASRDFSIKYWDLDKKEVIQVLKGHNLEVWALVTSSTGDFFVSSANDCSFSLWTQTENQLFLKEQKELEIEENLKPEDFGIVKGQKEKEIMTVTSSGVVAAAEGLIEALEICVQYREHLQSGENSLPPPQFAGKNEAGFVLTAIYNVPAQYLDSVLHLVPYNYALELFRFLEEFLDNRNDVELVGRCVRVLMKVHENALVSSTFCNEHWVKALDRVKDKLKSRMKEYRDLIGRNIAATRFILKGM